ncbi:hypothetical protein [Streptomyces lancefieldiae]|uniref:Uncharacterized protein n=1 Tax=Streptomyces lancefieldiae TaxID=3075520 RepID=A0ABU3ATG4_9ACTN|nr:hypothetical protein [Streptomyces sp. DSM 40712]MDT0612121.1 hypothetical protein [Streptomyces sp. DSM 40712]
MLEPAAGERDLAGRQADTEVTPQIHDGLRNSDEGIQPFHEGLRRIDERHHLLLSVPVSDGGVLAAVLSEMALYATFSRRYWMVLKGQESRRTGTVRREWGVEHEVLAANPLAGRFGTPVDVAFV